MLTLNCEEITQILKDAGIEFNTERTRGVDVELEGEEARVYSFAATFSRKNRNGETGITAVVQFASNKLTPPEMGAVAVAALVSWERIKQYRNFLEWRADFPNATQERFIRAYVGNRTLAYIFGQPLYDRVYAVFQRLMAEAAPVAEVAAEATHE